MPIINAISHVSRASCSPKIMRDDHNDIPIVVTYESCPNSTAYSYKTKSPHLSMPHLQGREHRHSHRVALPHHLSCQTCVKCSFPARCLALGSDQRALVTHRQATSTGSKVNARASPTIDNIPGLGQKSLPRERLPHRKKKLFNLRWRIQHLWYIEYRESEVKQVITLSVYINFGFPTILYHIYSGVGLSTHAESWLEQARLLVLYVRTYVRVRA